MKTILKLTAAAALALAAGPAIMAAEFPDPDRDAIQLWIAYGPGGATDFQARIATITAGNAPGDGHPGVGKPFLYINKPGAGGRKGWNEFADKAKADGHQLAAYNVPHFIAQSIVYGDEVRYGPDRLEPIANWGADPAVLIVAENSPFNSVKDIVDYARDNPGKLTVNGAGKFTGHHIALLQLEKAAGVKMKYIPDPKGGANALNQVKGGHIRAGFNNLSDAFRSKDELKILAVADLSRHDFLPEVPTFMEQGVAVDNSSVNFRGIMAPQGTPPEVIAYLAENVHRMFLGKRVAGKMKSTGSPLRVMTREEVRQMWDERKAYLSDLLKDLVQ